MTTFMARVRLPTPLRAEQPGQLGNLEHGGYERGRCLCRNQIPDSIQVARLCRDEPPEGNRRLPPLPAKKCRCLSKATEWRQAPARGAGRNNAWAKAVRDLLLSISVIRRTQTPQGLAKCRHSLSVRREAGLRKQFTKKCATAE
jgi:hypothetical protein